ncbi:ABC nitrate/sulfonate/bicarbonate transporter, inner membrane subunit [Devosia sp. LC5]|uniref:ABC transporter permease n=1 Tax=Devosia sp. LC5 TaxID=1502724 RepID=UPI0004E2AC99|nr:ABC transporter permease subunit [Devosia sp. LC5]KFC61738.1 ABC nitrate/sulfonate/bicarbonate transporter, inner membrane subunit [Devosia sp. LC5]
MTLQSEAVHRLVLGAVGVGLFLAIWQVIGTYRLAGMTWPPLTDVLAFIADPSKQGLFVRAMLASFASVALGYVVGILSGVAAAMLGQVLPIMRPGLDRLVAVIHAVPLVALAPVFMVLANRDLTPPAISALGVFYMIYVATTSGLKAASHTHRDLFTALGSSPTSRFLRLELPAALPALVSGMKLAIPVAFIGTIVGEWFGASRGLGLLMVSAMQNFQIPLLWSAVLIVTTASLALFGLMSLFERLVYGRFQ